MRYVIDIVMWFTNNVRLSVSVRLDELHYNVNKNTSKSRFQYRQATVEFGSVKSIICLSGLKY